jgi:hypothetical protein
VQRNEACWTAGACGESREEEKHGGRWTRREPTAGQEKPGAAAVAAAPITSPSTSESKTRYRLPCSAPASCCRHRRRPMRIPALRPLAASFESVANPSTNSFSAEILFRIGRELIVHPRPCSCSVTCDVPFSNFSSHITGLEVAAAFL